MVHVALRPKMFEENVHLQEDLSANDDASQNNNPKPPIGAVFRVPAKQRLTITNGPSTVLSLPIS